jgi:hypothetical protein
MLPEKPYLWLNRFLAGTELFMVRALRVLEEIPVLLSTPTLAERATADDFDRSPRYAHPAQQLLGLYRFEQRMVERFFPKPPARILAHGVGGGRELIALLAAGYTVEAHEPVPRLAAAAAKLAQERGYPNAVGVQRIQDWARDAPTPVDAVFLGWATYSHLLLQADRLLALRAFRAACPRGPVLMSFYRSFSPYDLEEVEPERAPLYPRWEHRITRTLRSGLRERLLRLPPIERGTAWGKGTFFHEVEPWELGEEAALCGYRVAYYEENLQRYPHAVLMPG